VEGKRVQHEVPEEGTSKVVSDFFGPIKHVISARGGWGGGTFGTGAVCAVCVVCNLGIIVNKYFQICCNLLQRNTLGQIYSLDNIHIRVIMVTVAETQHKPQSLFDIGCN